MCVRKISAQCVLQFTPSLAAGCVLHRPVSRVIHRSELLRVWFVLLRESSRRRTALSRLFYDGGARGVVRFSTFRSGARGGVPRAATPPREPFLRGAGFVSPVILRLSELVLGLAATPPRGKKATSLLVGRSDVTVRFLTTELSASCGRSHR